MRSVLVLFVCCCTALAGERAAAARLPAGASAYVELNGFAGKVDKVLASPLGLQIEQHPAVQQFLASPEGLKLMMGQAFLQGATGLDVRGLLRAVLAKDAAVAVYGKPQRLVAAAAMDRETAETLLNGVAVLAQSPREELQPAADGRPALWRIKKAYVFHDGEYLFVATDELLATAARNGVGEGLAAGERFREARRCVSADSLLFGYVDLDVHGAKLRTGGKPKDLGQALILGALAHVLPEAPWAAFGVRLDEQDDAWRLQARALVPSAAEPDEVIEKAYGGTLGALPFTLPERTLGVVRLRRDLATIWSNRDALVAERGIPGLVEFETNFANLTGGMSWVEQFLPALGGEFILLGTRREFAANEPAPAVRIPQGALLLPLRGDGALATNLQIAFQTAIGLVNLQQGQMGGKAFLLGAQTYKDVAIQTARYPAPTEAEMEGKQALPMRYNFTPSAACIGDYFVIASTDGILKELIDGYGKATPAPAGVNAGFWLEPAQLQRLGQENREYLVAQTMLKKGLAKAQAEQQVDVLLDAARFVRRFQVTADETRDGHALTLELAVGPNKER